MDSKKNVEEEVVIDFGVKRQAIPMQQQKIRCGQRLRIDQAVNEQAHRTLSKAVQVFDSRAHRD